MADRVFVLFLVFSNSGLGRLAIMLLVVVTLDKPSDDPSEKADWSLQPALRTMDIFKK